MDYTKVIFIVKLSLWYFKKAFETLYVGLKDPEKFYKEEKRNDEIIRRILPLLVANSLSTPQE